MQTNKESHRNGQIRIVTLKNEVLRMFKEKQDYKQAIKYTGNTGFDEVDIALKQKYVDSVYFEKEGKKRPEKSF